MLRRAITCPHLPHHSPFHCQCLSYPLLRPSLHLQGPTNGRTLSSTSRDLSESPRKNDSQNSSSPIAASTSASEVEDGSSAGAAPPAGVEKNAFGAARDRADGATKVTKLAALATGSSSPPTPRTIRPRALRPLVIPKIYPPSLLPIAPTLEPPREQVAPTTTTTPEKDSSLTTITLAGLPPNTLKAEIRPVLQRFGEVVHILIHPGGRHADVTFADGHGVKRTLHAYAERPLCVRGEEVIVFRKHIDREDLEGGVEEEFGAAVDTAWRDDDYRSSTSSSSYSRVGKSPNDGAIFVSGFLPGTTLGEISEALAQFGKYERMVMRPDSKYAFFMYSSKNRVQELLRVHQRVPVTLHGRTLRIESSENRPYSLSPENQSTSLELGKPLDPMTSSAIVEELKRTVPKWRGLNEPSRVIWIGRLPLNMSPKTLANFWSRLGCVVDVRTSMNGFAHVEFASTEEALRAVRQGAPHGFRYKERLLDVDFAPWVFYLGPAYRVVYISGWPASNGRNALLQWMYDIPNVVGASVFPPFRGEGRSDARCAYLQLGTIDDARAALRRLDGRAGPGGEKLQVGLARLPVVHPNRLWRWAYEVQERERKGDEGEEANFKEEWAGLGFGPGWEGQGTEDVSDGLGEARATRSSWRGSRGGRWKPRKTGLE